MSAIDRYASKRKMPRRRLGLGRRKQTDARAALEKHDIIAIAMPERFHVANIQIENPRIGEPPPPGSVPVAATLKHYDPKEYAEKGTGVQHVKQSTDREVIEELVERRDSGSLKSTAESSHGPRDYTEVTYETPTGRRIRRHRDVDTFV